MFRTIVVYSLLLVVGCAPPYKPTTKTNTPDKPTQTVSASKAFDIYKKDTAANFRQLAVECENGTYEYVSELVDASKKLDKLSKDKRSRPIDQVFAKELGNDKLDKDKAVEVLNKIADDLDPPPVTIKKVKK